MPEHPRFARPAILAFAAAAISLGCGEDPLQPPDVSIQAAKGGNKGGGNSGGGGGELAASGVAAIPGPWSVAFDINDAGVVIGFRDLEDGSSTSFAWSLSGGLVDLSSLDGDGVHSLDDADVLLGYEAYWLPDGAGGWQEPDPLPVPTGWTRLLAQEIARSDAQAVSWITGYARDAADINAALRWRLEGGTVVGEEIPRPATTEELDHFAGYGVNSAGHVVGVHRVRVSNSDRRSRAFIWQGDPNAAPLFLPDLSGSTWAHAQAINDHGVVVGWATAKGNKTVPVRWTPTSPGSAIYGEPEVLPIPAREGRATVINNAGQIAGDLPTSSNGDRGFLYDPADGSTVVLAPLADFDRSVVSGINANGGVNCAGVVAGYSANSSSVGQTGREGAVSLWQGRDPGC